MRDVNKWLHGLLPVALAGWALGCAGGGSMQDTGQPGQKTVAAPSSSTSNGIGAGGAAAGPSASSTNSALPSSAAPAAQASPMANPSTPAPGASMPGVGGAAGAAGPAAMMDAMGAAGADAPAPTQTFEPTPHGTSTCLQAGNGNYMAPGPYQVAKMDVDLGMIQDGQHTGKFTIYYPNPMEADCPHPIVAWGNGTGVTDSDFTYDFLNSNAASWGIVVASSSEDNTGTGAFHQAGIDYLLAQNEDPNSMFFHKLSTRAGVAGHSQGGFGANVGAMHPNVEAAVVEGATFVSNDKVAGLTMTGTNDLGTSAADGVPLATGPMFVVVWDGGNHVGTETVLGFLGLDSTSGDAEGSQKGSVQFQRLYAAWFRCFLADDQVACGLFQGGTPDSCGICGDPGWALLASNM